MTEHELDALLDRVVTVPAVSEDDCPWCLGQVRGRGEGFTIIGYCPPDHLDCWHLQFGLDGALFRRAYEDELMEEDFERAVNENRLDEAKGIVRIYVLRLLSSGYPWSQQPRNAPPGPTDDADGDAA